MSVPSSLRFLILVPLAAACDLQPPPEITLDDGGTPGVVIRALEEGSPLVSEPLAIRNNGRCNLSYTASVGTANGGEWLFLNQNTGFIAAQNVSSELELQLWPSNRLPGLYTGSLRLEAICDATGLPAKGSPVVVAINLRITPRSAAVLSPDGKYFAVDLATLGGTKVQAMSAVGAPDFVQRTPAVWSGSEMLLLGGDDPVSFAHAYDPDLDEWRALGPAPRGRTDHTVTPDGAGFILCGGVGISDCDWYSPDLGWAPLGSMPSSRYRHTTVKASGYGLIVFGGRGPDHLPAAGGWIQDPTGSWNALETEGAPAARYWHQAFWTGSEMLVLFGRTSGSGFADGGAYNPQTRNWRATAPSPLGGSLEPATCAWTGREVICTALTGVSSYDPLHDEWTVLPVDAGLVANRNGATVTWTGSEVVILGGYGPEGTVTYGAAYDPELQSWRALGAIGAESRDAVTVFTGDRLIFWGGSAGSVGSIFQ